MKLKTIEVEGQTYACVKDGNPVYIKDDGSEVTPDITAAPAKISQLNREAQAHREAKERLEAQLKAFEGIEDPDEARKALETVRGMGDGELVAAGKLEEVRERAKKAADEQVQAAVRQLNAKLAEVTADRDGIRNEYHGEKITNAFASSKYITDNVAIPAELLKAQFGANFKIEDGKIVGRGPNGEVIPSKTNIGDPASFEEAIETLVQGYTHRDLILKGANNGGGGARPGGGGSGRKVMTRSEYDNLDAKEQHGRMTTGWTISG